MLSNRPRNDQRLLDRITNLESELDNYEGHSAEYSAITDQLVKLYKVKDTQVPSRISPDTIAMIAANLGGILLILSYERANVVTSKAMGFVSKLR